MFNKKIINDLQKQINVLVDRIEVLEFINKNGKAEICDYSLSGIWLRYIHNGKFKDKKLFDYCEYDIVNIEKIEKIENDLVFIKCIKYFKYKNAQYGKISDFYKFDINKERLVQIVNETILENKKKDIGVKNEK